MSDKEKLYLKGGPMLIDMGDHCKEFSGGDALVGVSEGTLDTLIRLGQAVTKDKLKDEEGGAPGIEHDSRVSGPTLRDLGLDEGIVTSLEEAGLATVEDVIVYGADHDGSLLEVPGIGEAREKDIKAALKKMKR